MADEVSVTTQRNKPVRERLTRSEIPRRCVDVKYPSEDKIKSYFDDMRKPLKEQVGNFEDEIRYDIDKNSLGMLQISGETEQNKLMPSKFFSEAIKSRFRGFKERPKVEEYSKETDEIREAEKDDLIEPGVLKCSGFTYKDLQQAFAIDLYLDDQKEPYVKFGERDHVWMETMFKCYPVNALSGFRMYVYFVDVTTSSSAAITEEVYKTVVRCIPKALLGDWKFLPNHKIATTQEIRNWGAESDTFKVRVTSFGKIVNCCVRFVLLSEMIKGPMSKESVNVLHHVITDILREDCRLWHMGGTYFVCDEKKLVEPGKPENNFLLLGTGFRVSVVSSDESCWPLIKMEPYLYVRDTRGILKKLKRFKELSQENNTSLVCGQHIPQIFIMSRLDKRSFKIDEVSFEKNPLSAVEKIDGLCMSYLDWHKEKHGDEIEYLYQPLMTSTPNFYDKDLVSDASGKSILIPEFCDQIKLKLVTRDDINSDVLSRIIPSLDEWRFKMDKFLRSTRMSLDKHFSKWKLYIGREGLKPGSSAPRCGVPSDDSWCMFAEYNSTN